MIWFPTSKKMRSTPEIQTGCTRHGERDADKVTEKATDEGSKVKAYQEVFESAEREGKVIEEQKRVLEGCQKSEEWHR